MNMENDTVMPSPDDALGLLGELFAEPAPSGVRARVLARVSASPRPRITSLDPVEVLATTIAGVAAVLDSLSPPEWETPAVLAELDVKRTVAHLEGADRYLGVKVGAWSGTVPADEHDHRAASQTEIDRAATLTPAAVVQAWKERSGALVDALRALPAARLAEPAKYHIFEATLGAVLIARAFEVWTHGEDICRATGRPLNPPPAAALAAMTDAGAGLVPLGYQLRHGPAAATVRVVLTGEGGGAWTFRLGPDAPATPTATIVTDAVGFCRLVANRVSPADLDCEIEGDEILAERALVGASMLALD